MLMASHARGMRTVVDAETTYGTSGGFGVNCEDLGIIFWVIVNLQFGVEVELIGDDQTTCDIERRMIRLREHRDISDDLLSRKVAESLEFFAVHNDASPPS